jgi:hypothetical protein
MQDVGSQFCGCFQEGNQVSQARYVGIEFNFPKSPRLFSAHGGVAFAGAEDSL